MQGQGIEVFIYARSLLKCPSTIRPPRSEGKRRPIWKQFAFAGGYTLFQNGATVSDIPPLFGVPVWNPIGELLVNLMTASDL
jgi:hypothetical protein